MEDYISQFLVYNDNETAVTMRKSKDDNPTYFHFYKNLVNLTTENIPIEKTYTVL